MPLTASAPMSPPGKNSGCTTYESVVNARRPAGGFEHGAVVPRVQARVAERRHEQLLDQLVHQLAAAAVREQHVRILCDRQRAATARSLRWSSDQRP